MRDTRAPMASATHSGRRLSASDQARIGRPRKSRGTTLTGPRTQMLGRALDMACFAAGRRGRGVRRVDGNPHYPSYDPKPRCQVRTIKTRCVLTPPRNAVAENRELGPQVVSQLGQREGDSP